MTAICTSCRQKQTVKKLKGKCPVCGYWNSLVRIPKERKSK